MYSVLLCACYKQVIQQFCASAQHLKHNTDWVQVKRMRTAAQVGQQQHFQQHLQQFKMGQTPPGPGVTQPGPGATQPGPAVTQPGPGVSSPWFSRSGSGGPAAAAAGAGAAWQQETQPHEPQRQAQQQQQHAPLLTADSEVYQGLLDSKVLSEPKKAAQAAWDQWQLGRSIAQIATEGRDKPIQVCID